MWECKCCLGFGLALVGRESNRNRVNNFNPFVQKRGCWAVYKNKLNWNANFMLIERGFYAAIDFMSCFLACLNGAFFRDLLRSADPETFEALSLKACHHSGNCSCNFYAALRIKFNG